MTVRWFAMYALLALTSGGAGCAASTGPSPSDAGAVDGGSDGAGACEQAGGTCRHVIDINEISCQQTETRLSIACPDPATTGGSICCRPR